jgi:hypothetical protein
VLQPAQLQPVPLQPGLAPVGAASIGSPATYGTLMAAAREAVEDALALGAARLPDAETGARELAGYARFLRYAGNHLHTLMRLGEVRNDHTRRLVQRLNTITEDDPTHGPNDGSDHRPGGGLGGVGGGRWLQAATVLGTAHDLLATHLTGVGIPRTPEGEETLTGPRTVVACVELAELILTAVDGSHELIHRTARTQQARGTKVVPTKAFKRLHATNRAASLCARAALWDLNRQPPGMPATRLGGLRAAIDLDGPRPPEFATTLAALRLLRHYSYTQAHGQTPASPASLRDLALLGARITDPDTALGDLAVPPKTDTPLGRLQRAHLTDQLNHAHQAWTAAGAELTRTVQGLTKAPATYAATIHQLLETELTPGLRRAISSALPRIGIDAAATIERLSERAELVTLQRPPLATRHEWRPIHPDHAARLAAQFTTAAHASRQALATLASVQAPARHPEHDRHPRQLLQAELQQRVQR